MFSVNVPPRGDRPRALGVTLVGGLITFGPKPFVCSLYRWVPGGLTPDLLTLFR